MTWLSPAFGGSDQDLHGSVFGIGVVDGQGLDQLRISDKHKLFLPFILDAPMRFIYGDDVLGFLVAQPIDDDLLFVPDHDHIALNQSRIFRISHQDLVEIGPSGLPIQDHPDPGRREVIELAYILIGLVAQKVLDNFLVLFTAGQQVRIDPAKGLAFRQFVYFTIPLSMIQFK